MAAMTEVKCQHCKKPFMARVADRKRGWGLFCSKSCKAIKQEKRTGQMSDFVNRKVIRSSCAIDEVRMSDHDSDIEIAHDDEYEWNDWDYK